METHLEHLGRQQVIIQVRLFTEMTDHSLAVWDRGPIDKHMVLNSNIREVDVFIVSSITPRHPKDPS